MEAEGIEPSSEKARPAKTTCVADSLFFVRPLMNRQEADSLARLDLGFTAPSRSLQPSLRNDACRLKCKPISRSGYLIN